MTATQNLKIQTTSESTCAQLSAFDTVVTVRIESTLPEATDALIEVTQLCEHYEHLFSRTRPSGWLNRLHRASPAWIRCPKDLYELLQEGLYYSQTSSGMFTIAIGSLTKLWDFKQGIIPAHHEINQALGSIQLDALELSSGRARLTRRDTLLDLGGIAKGYIADKLSEHLKSKGFTNHLINLGGNVLSSGSTYQGKPWIIGIKDPFDPESLVAEIKLNSGSVVTSGIYERSFIKDGRLYHHILDPETGYPHKTDLVSASLVCQKSIQAEGYSSTVLALGFDRANLFMEEHPEILEAVLIRQDGRVFRLRRGYSLTSHVVSK